VHRKSRGRPAGKTYSETIPAPLELATVASLDAWAVANEVSRSEAIRRLVEIGLSKSEPPKRPKVRSTTKQSAARARELAAMTLDKHSDPAASEEEKKVRKQKLIQRPSAFRDTRKDRPGK
jgi:hypothetical protein